MDRSREARHLFVTEAAGRWADVAAVELDPGVRALVAGVRQEPNDKLGRLPLLAKEAKEHQRADEAPRPAVAESKASVNRSAQGRGPILRV